MANLREPYAIASLQSLAWNEDWERAIDRIAAAGMCNTIGITLWRARYALDVGSYRTARRDLLRFYRDRYKAERTDIAERIVDQCLHEFLSSACPVCSGAREVVIGDLRQICDGCNGSGLHRYSDSQRSRAMHLSYGLTKHLANKIRWLLDHMATWDAEVNATMNNQLERDRIS